VKYKNLNYLPEHHTRSDYDFTTYDGCSAPIRVTSIRTGIGNESCEVSTVWCIRHGWEPELLEESPVTLKRNYCTARRKDGGQCRVQSSSHSPAAPSPHDMHRDAYGVSWRNGKMVKAVVSIRVAGLVEQVGKSTFLQDRLQHSFSLMHLLKLNIEVDPNYRKSEWRTEDEDGNVIWEDR